MNFSFNFKDGRWSFQREKDGEGWRGMMFELNGQSCSNYVISNFDNGLMMFIIHHYQMRQVVTTSQEYLDQELKPVPETACSAIIQRIQI